MTEFDHDWTETDSYLDMPNGCGTLIVIIVITILFLVGLLASI